MRLKPHANREREREEKRKKRLEREGYKAEPSANGKRLQGVWCFKCGALIAEVERAGPDDVIVLPPDQVDYSGPLKHPWTVVVSCRRCREKRAIIQHSGLPPAKNP